MTHSIEKAVRLSFRAQITSFPRKRESLRSWTENDPRFREGDEAWTFKSGSRVRFLAEFTLSTQSEILRFAQDDSEGLGMTAGSADLPFWVCGSASP